MMPGWSNNVRIGTVGGTPIVADLSLGAMGGDPIVKRITLSSDFVVENVPGFPARRGLGGVIRAYPHTIPSGTTYETSLPEAAALVAAGAAVYA